MDTNAKRPPSRELWVRSGSAKYPVPPKSKPSRNAAPQKRVQSAQAIRDKHNASLKVFPHRPPSRPSKERYTSMYSSDFDGKFVCPADLRPTSPTRRNNPHPTKQFMLWRVPSREIGMPDSEEFFPDGEFSVADGSEYDELGPSIDQLKLPPPQPTSKDYGAYLHKQLQRRSQLPPIGVADDMMKTKTKGVSSDILERTLRGENTEALDTWLKTASPHEQSTVLKMLKKAEEAQMKDTVDKVMQPAAAKAVQNWLKSADNREREVAVRLFSSLGSRPGHSRTLSQDNFQGGDPTAIVAAERKRLHSRRMSAPAENLSRYPPAIWHHQSIRNPPPQVYHRASLFGTVRGPASHYKVHPEWPEYFPNPTYDEDAVH